MFEIAVNHEVYHIMSAILGGVLLLEALRATCILIKISKHPYHKIESVLRNLEVANIILLLLLATREIAEAIILNRNGIDYQVLSVLRIIPPIIYIYIHRVVSTLLIDNERFGIADCNDLISISIKCFRRKKK